MKFLIQWNLMNEDSLQKLKKAVDGYPHEYIEVIPFSKDFSTEVLGVDYIPYGSTLLTNIAHERGYTGLFFDKAVFTYTESRKHLDRLMLNQGIIVTIQEAINTLAVMQTAFPNTPKVFLRPDEDLKYFSGTVMEVSEAIPWLEDVISLGESNGSYYMTPDTKIVISAPLEIQAEWRWFIVDGKIVDGSMYRCNGQMRILHEDDADVIQEVTKLIEGKWLPSPCCVMDTALVDGEVKIIEFNTINSSGLYDNDAAKIVKALWTYVMNHPR